jgi:hypothetical protein
VITLNADLATGITTSISEISHTAGAKEISFFKGDVGLGEDALAIISFKLKNIGLLGAYVSVFGVVLLSSELFIAFGLITVKDSIFFLKFLKLPEHNKETLDKELTK